MASVRSIPQYISGEFYVKLSTPFPVYGGFCLFSFFIGSAGLTILSEGYTVPLGNVP